MNFTARFVFLLFASLIPVLIPSGCSKSSSDLPPGVEYYTCSMHPQVRADKPGECPICGMNLVAVRSQQPGAQVNQEASQKPQVVLSKVPGTIDYYTCSMHPQVRSDKPGDCPICGMDLTPVMVSSSKSGMPSGADEVHLTREGVHQAGVQIAVAEKRKLAKELLIFGTLGYNLNLHRDVVPLVSGRIDAQLIDFNRNEVKKGDPLVRIYSPEAIELQRKYLDALRERWLSTFYERELLSSRIELAKEELKRIGFTESELKLLEENKEVKSHIILRAPVSGSIVGNMVHIGEWAKPDQPLYHIVPLDELWFNAQVFEPDLGLLKLGQTVRISTKSYPDEVFSGRLTYIGRTLDQSNRTIPVRFSVSNKDGRLLPNLSASGELEIPLEKDVPSVPNSAVLDLGTRHVVYVEKSEGVYEARNVKIGFITRHETQIVEGVSEGEKVVSAGAFLVDAQAQLRAGTNPVAPNSPIDSQEPAQSPVSTPAHQH
jgi:membrane fusion protein, copper/silver efflux system